MSQSCKPESVDNGREVWFSLVTWVVKKYKNFAKRWFSKYLDETVYTVQ